jgi:hypothetical protein
MSESIKKQEAQDVSQARSVAVAVIKCGDGRCLIPSLEDGRRLTADTLASYFEVTRWGSEEVALRSVSTRKFVSADLRGGVFVGADEIGPSEMFTLVEPEPGKTAFLLPDGKNYLSVGSGSGDGVGVSSAPIGANELFAMAYLTGRPPVTESSGCCCGPQAAISEEDEPSVVWNDETHKLAVETGVHVLINMANPTPEAQEFKRTWNGNFWGPLFRGLHDADYKDPWYAGGIYKDHFYDPATERNYLGELSSALTECRRWFNLSVHSGRRGYRLPPGQPKNEAYARAGYYLGLALHFFTDLTQPMHAANFIYLPVVQPQHKIFEDYTESVRDRYLTNPAPITPADLQFPAGVDAIGQMIYQLSVYSKQVFNERVLPIIRSGGRFDGGPQVDAILNATLRKSPTPIARYLAYWAHRVVQEPTIVPSHWYEFVEPTRGELVGLDGGLFKRTNVRDDRTMFFFLFNEDGTWSIACKGFLRNLMFVHGNGSIGEHNAGTIIKETRFRFLRDGDKMWIYEPTRDEVLGVGSTGNLVRWNPCEPWAQLFKPLPVRPITEAEKAQIKEVWRPNFQRFTWWGGEP